MGIFKVVAAVTDLKTINFAREHYFTRSEKKNERKHYVLCCELDFKLGELRGGHSNNINVNTQGRWNGTRTRGRYIQCNVTLCTEGKCFKIYYNKLR